ncbi:MAG: glycosyltransferase family 39 protein [Desulfobacterales bacterium]|nr:glycosyltransferase family 39 protein [Desulfobacterales bacterium]
MKLITRSSFGKYLPVLFLLLASLYLFGWKIGSYSLNDPWEPKYPQTVREMMERGDYITPYYQDQIRWTKPILIYWAMIPPVLIFGNNEFSARLPSVLAALFGVWAVYYCLLNLRGRRAAIIGGFILATIPEYFFMARQAMPDMLMTAFLSSGMCFFALGRFQEKHRKKHFYLFYASLAMAVLAKGPVAGAIATFSILIFWSVEIDSRSFFNRNILNEFGKTLKFYQVVPGIIIFLLIAGPWYIAIYSKHHTGFVENFVMDQNIRRFTGTMHGGLGGNADHYIETVFHGMFPWNSFIPAAMFFLCLGHMKKDNEVRENWFYLSWIMSTFLIFTLAKTKLDHYILPLAVPLAMIVAVLFDEYLKNEPPLFMRSVFIVSIPFAILPFNDFLTRSNKYIMDAFTNKHVITNMNIALGLKCILGAWIIAILSAIIIKNSKVAATCLILLVAYCSAIYFSHYVLPGQEHVRSVRQYVEYCRKHGGPDALLLFYGNFRSSVVYYSGGSQGYQYFNRRTRSRMASFVKGKKAYIIIEKKKISSVIKFLRIKTNCDWVCVGRSNPKYRLFTNHKP